MLCGCGRIYYTTFEVIWCRPVPIARVFSQPVLRETPPEGVPFWGPLNSRGIGLGNQMDDTKREERRKQGSRMTRLISNKKRIGIAINIIISHRSRKHHKKDETIIIQGTYEQFHSLLIDPFRVLLGASFDISQVYIAVTDLAFRTCG